MNFMNKLCNKINEIDGLPASCTMGYLGTGESFVLYPIPNSKVTAEYMDGTTDQQLNYEIAMKSKRQSKIHETLWVTQNALEALEDIDGSGAGFEFDKITITNKPFIDQIDEQGWYVFVLEIQAKITVFKK